MIKIAVGSTKLETSRRQLKCVLLHVKNIVGAYKIIIFAN
jgi:hypothetical protein